MFLLFLILGLGNFVRWPDKKWWAVDVGSFVGQQKRVEIFSKVEKVEKVE